MFVPQDQKALAYMDAVVPITLDKTISARALLAPMTLGKLLQSAEPRSSDKVLDVGGVSGYSAAILAQVCKSVVALEASQNFADFTIKSLKDANIKGVKVVPGQLPAGYTEGQPYDLIVLNGSVPEEPRTLFDQLAEGGRLVGIIGGRWLGQAYI